MIDPGNKQGYANGPLSDSSIEADYKELPDTLFNSKPPNLGILSESPLHRQVIYLRAQGMRQCEIARRMGFTDAWVSQILRQPWARVRLLEELKLAGREGVQGILQSEAEEAVFRVIELSRTAEDESVKLRANDSILDRFLGKAIQKVESKIESHVTVEDVSQIDRELAETEREINRLAGKATAPPKAGVPGIPQEAEELLQVGESKALGA